MRSTILAFAAGIACLQSQPDIPDWGVWMMAAGPVMLLTIGRTIGLPLRLLGLVAAMAFGFGWSTWLAQGRLADRLPSEWEGQDVEVIGTIAVLPQSFHQGSRFEFDVESVQTPGARLPSHIMLSWYQGRRDGEDFLAQPIRPGERWRLTVRLKRPHGNANPSGFDYEAWLLERNIRATGYVRPKSDAKRLVEMVWRPGYVVERLRHAIRTSFQAILSEEQYPYGGILIALAIGDQRAIQGELWSTFNRTGVTHLVSI